MSVKIQVTDSDKRPIKDVEVFVKWATGGHSSRRTNSAGIADLECSGGMIEYINVDGRNVSGSFRANDDEVYPVSNR